MIIRKNYIPVSSFEWPSNTPSSMETLQHRLTKNGVSCPALQGASFLFTSGPPLTLRGHHSACVPQMAYRKADIVAFLSMFAYFFATWVLYCQGVHSWPLKPVDFGDHPTPLAMLGWDGGIINYKLNHADISTIWNLEPLSTIPSSRIHIKRNNWFNLVEQEWPSHLNSPVVYSSGVDIRGTISETGNYSSLGSYSGW